MNHPWVNKAVNYVTGPNALPEEQRRRVAHLMGPGPVALITDLEIQNSEGIHAKRKTIANWRRRWQIKPKEVPRAQRHYSQCKDRKIMEEFNIFMQAALKTWGVSSELRTELERLKLERRTILLKRTSCVM